MEPRPASRVATRIIAALAALVAAAGFILLLGPYGAPPADGIEGIGVAFQTLLGGALLVGAALLGLAAGLIWLLAERRTRRLR
jgi:hypothetical protein